MHIPGSCGVEGTFFYSVVPLQGWINLHSTISNTRTDIHTHLFCDGLRSGHGDRINMFLCSRASVPPGSPVT